MWIHLYVDIFQLQILQYYVICGCLKSADVEEMWIWREDYEYEGTTVSYMWLTPILFKRKRKSLSRVGLFAMPWTIQSMEFSRPEY